MLVDNAMTYAGQYALGAGLQRRNSHAGIPPTCVGDVPVPMSNPEWILFKALSEWLLSGVLRVAPF